LLALRRWLHTVTSLLSLTRTPHTMAGSSEPWCSPMGGCVRDGSGDEHPWDGSRPDKPCGLPGAYACTVAGLHDISDATFSWHRVKGVKHTIELHAGDQVFGTLRFDGVKAVAEVDGQRWAFTRHKKQVIIRDAHGTVAGTFTATKRGEGQLELTDGLRFWWRPTHPGQAERGFYDADGGRVVRFWKATRLLSAEDRGAADPGRSALPQFPLLIMLGRVISIGQDELSAALSGVIAATS